MNSQFELALILGGWCLLGWVSLLGYWYLLDKKHKGPFQFDLEVLWKTFTFCWIGVLATVMLIEEWYEQNKNVPLFKKKTK